MGQLRSDFPSVIVEADFGDNAFANHYGWLLGTSTLGVDTYALGDGVLWTDISEYVRDFNITRGRTDELSPVSPGTATITLNNRDRRFEPDYASSPYYPYVLPLRRIRIRALWNGTSYPLFTGYVADWPLDWSRSPEDQQSAVACVDGFEPLNQAQLTHSFSSQMSGARMNALLDQVGWNSTERAIDGGQAEIAASDLSQTPGLTHANDVANSELGLFFFDASGLATFHDRSRRQGSYASLGTFGDDPSTEVPYEDIKFVYTKQLVRNDAQVTRPGGTLQEITDSTSTAAYFTRTWTASPLLTSDSDALDMATWIVGKYKDPHLRVSTLTLRPTIKPDTCWPQALGREIGDRLSYIRRPPAGGTALSGDAFIDGVSHSVMRSGSGWIWRTIWNLAPASLYAAWVLGQSTLGADTYAAL